MPVPSIIGQALAKIATKQHLPGAHSLADISSTRLFLLEWYDQHQRSLPWRKNIPFSSSDPTDEEAQRAYEVWVSEIMLQQTQVVKVLEYYSKWIKAWPTLLSLSQATLEEVHAVWSGLGYYSRATRMLQAAKLIVETMGGVLPKNVKALLDVPGVGPYTAGAIASIAYNMPVPIVDGNVIRVLSRLCAIAGDPKSKENNNLHWFYIDNDRDLAGQVVDPDRPGEFNQALMDLGATVCTPKNPDCTACSIKTVCRANAEVDAHRQFKSKSLVLKCERTNKISSTDVVTKGYEDDIVQESTENILNCTLCPQTRIADLEDFSVTYYPSQTTKKDARIQRIFFIIIDVVCTIVQSADHFLIIKGPTSGLLANLWDFPQVIVEEEQVDQHMDIINQLLIPLDFVKSIKLGTIVHKFSHIHRTIHLELVRLAETPTVLLEVESESKWVLRDEMEKMAVPMTLRKCLKALDVHLNGPTPVKRKAKKEEKDDPKQPKLSFAIKRKEA